MRILTFPIFVSLLVGSLICASNGFQTTSGSNTRLATVPTILRPRAKNDCQYDRRSVACHIASLRDETNLPAPKNSLSGLGILFTVPIAWGTYNPVVKYLYTLEHPVPGLVFSVGYFWVGATTLWILQAILGNNEENKSSSIAASVGADDVSDADDATAPNQALQWQCGFELGTYLFMGAMLQVWGLRTVPADRAAFLVQLTTVIVPFMEYFMGGKALSRTTIGASVLAFVGVVLIEMEGTSESLFSETLLSGNPTDLLFLLAAVFYSLHVVRLGHYAPKLEPLQLAKSKATAQGVLSTGFLASLLWLFPTDNPLTMEVMDFFDNYSLSAGLPAAAVAGILWMGWSTGSWAIFAQSLGQKLVSSPTTANMVYSLQPLFTAMFAYVLLGEEISGMMGGSCILGAVCLVGNQQKNADAAMEAVVTEQHQPLAMLPQEEVLVERRISKATRTID